MKEYLPAVKPAVDLTKISKLAANSLAKEKVCLVGIRGFYNPGNNKRGIYDDALFWVTASSITPFNANLDPGAFREGIATLKTGVWRYKMGNHNSSYAGSYPAFRQAARVTVQRDNGKGGVYEDSSQDDFGINIHKGGASSVSSLGCQTLPPNQWDSFKELGYSLLKKAGQQSFNYVLVEA